MKAVIVIKPFKLNPKFSASLKEVFYEGKPIENSKEKIEVIIEGSLYLFDRFWFGLVCHYELDFPIHQLRVVNFLPCSSKVLKIRCGFLPVFEKRLQHHEDFYIIPGFSRFAINKSGTIISRKTGRILKIHQSAYGYPASSVYDPDKEKWRPVCIHILLARTFIPNNSPEEKPFVNHKDGNKTNRNILNLEWTSSYANNTHAFKTGLRTDNIPCKVRDLVTGKIFSHVSIGSALKSIGCKNNSLFSFENINGQRRPKILKDRFEIKLDKNLDWFYKVGFIPKRSPLKPPFQALNILTQEVFESSSVGGLAKLIKLSERKIRVSLRTLSLKSKEGYVFRTKSSEPWGTYFEKVNSCNARHFILTHEETGQIKTFDSRNQAVKFLSVDKRTFFNYFEKHIPLKGWFIEEIQ